MSLSGARKQDLEREVDEMLGNRTVEVDTDPVMTEYRPCIEDIKDIKDTNRIACSGQVLEHHDAESKLPVADALIKSRDKIWSVRIDSLQSLPFWCEFEFPTDKTKWPCTVNCKGRIEHHATDKMKAKVDTNRHVTVTSDSVPWFRLEFDF